MPFDATMGRARVIEIRDGHPVKAEELRPHDIQKDERVLFETQNSARRWPEDDAFEEDSVFISQGAARFLAEREIRTVGVDYLSVGGFREDGEEAHRALLGAGIWVIEGLDLSGIEPGEYGLICLPIEVRRSDGAGDLEEDVMIVDERHETAPLERSFLQWR